MRLRSGRILSHQTESNHSIDSLSETEISLLQSIMSQQNENLSAHGSDHGEHDPLDGDAIKPLKDYLHPPRQTTPSCIILPINHHRFVLKPGTIQMLPTFYGTDSENPYTHMRDFEEIYGTCGDQNIHEDTVRLKLLAFSLKDKAKMWLGTLEPRSIGTWREMQTKFLKKILPS